MTQVLARDGFPRLDMSRYRSALFDLDGTMYLEGDPLPGAGAFVRACREAGMRVGFITNMAYEQTSWCIAGLARCGVEARPEQILTAAESVAHAMHEDGVGSAAYIGGLGLQAAIAARGIQLAPVGAIDPDVWLENDGSVAKAVAVGMHPDMTRDELGRAARLIARGLPVYVSSVDQGMPTRGGGVLPGAGRVLAALAERVTFEPKVCGKPSVGFGALARRLVDGCGPTLLVGDSIESDVALADREGWDSLLVLTGITTAEALGSAVARPTYVEATLESAHARAFGARRAAATVLPPPDSATPSTKGAQRER